MLGSVLVCRIVCLRLRGHVQMISHLRHDLFCVSLAMRGAGLFAHQILFVEEYLIWWLSLLQLLLSWPDLLLVFLQLRLLQPFHLLVLRPSLIRVACFLVRGVYVLVLVLVLLHWLPVELLHQLLLPWRLEELLICAPFLCR